MSDFTVFSSGLFHSTEIVENDTPVRAVPPILHELPADWDGKNTYNPQERDTPIPVTPPYTPDGHELPADWDGKNTYNPQERDTPIPVTPPYTPDGHELPADWDGKNTYNPQEPNGVSSKLAIGDILDMEDNAIDQLLQSNFEPAQQHTPVAGADTGTPSASVLFTSDDVAHLQFKGSNGDF